MTDLNINKKYQVSRVRRVETKYGFRIVAELENEFWVFLPLRIGKFIVEQGVESLDHLKNNCVKKHVFLKYFGGKTNEICFQYE